MNTRLFWCYLAVLSLATGLFAACSSHTLPMPSDTSFQIVIFKNDWSELRLGYQAQDALPRIQTLEEDDILFVISLKDIELYNWDYQTITLTQKATEQLAITLNTDHKHSEAAEALMDMRKSLGWGNYLERALYTKPFSVKIDDTVLYSGIFLNAVSQMAIDYPVIRMSEEHGKAVIAVLPVHIPFTMIDPVDGSGMVREPSLPQEVKQDTPAMNDFFSKVISDNSKKDVANEFRTLIRDDRVKQIFEAIGKLQN